MAIFKNTEQSKVLDMVALRDELEQGFSSSISEKFIQHEQDQNKKIEEVFLICQGIKYYLDSHVQENIEHIKELKNQIKKTKVMILFVVVVTSLGFYLK